MSKVLLSESHRASYLHEILKTYGVGYIQRSSLEDALEQAVPRQDVVIISSDAFTEGQMGLLLKFVERGGAVVAACCTQELADLAGLQPFKPEGSKEEELVQKQPERIRWVSPVCYAARSESLLTVGSIWKLRAIGEGEALGYLYRSQDFTSESIGVWRTEIGGGTLTLYAYDIALCVARLRQGFPEKATQSAKCAPTESTPTPRAIHLHDTAAERDTFWKPTADLHASAFVEVVIRQISQPMPRLWHLPNVAPSIVIYTGDEDGAPQTANSQQMEAVSAAGGRMSLYVMPDYTSMTPSLAEEYMKEGHSISVHPDLTVKNTASQEEQILWAREQVERFKRQFGLPVRTVRNHCYMWPGYLEIPNLWEELGIGLDLNTTGTLYGQSLDIGPYANAHSAMPMRFVREDGSLIHVFQQCTHFNDDLTANPSGTFSAKYIGEASASLVDRVITDAASYFHTPVCINIHPENYVSFSAPLSTTILQRAANEKIPIWSADQWYQFWNLRDQWGLSHCEWNNGALTLQYEGPPCLGLSILLPAEHDNACLKEFMFDREGVKIERVIRSGRDFVAVTIPSDSRSIKVTAFYQ